MINKIKEILKNNNDIYAWEIKQVESDSEQLFLIKNYIENKRNVKTNEYFVTVYHKHIVDNKEYLGYSVMCIENSDINVKEKIDNALKIATYSNNIPYELYNGGGVYSSKDSKSIKIEKDKVGLLFEYYNKYMELENEIKPARFSSLELFATLHNIVYLNSKGTDVSEIRTSFEMDSVLLSGDGNKDMEYHNYKKVVFPEMLDFEGELRKSSKYATDSLKAVLPKSGEYPVILMEEPLEVLFNPLVFQTSGKAFFQKQSLLETGKDVIDNVKGDRITIISNANVKNGLNSVKFDRDGFPIENFTIVENGIFKKRWNSIKYAQYIDGEHTGTFANTEIKEGSISMDEFNRDEGIVYYIMSFSSFYPDPISGTFGGEIRHGYEISANGIKPIRGGSITGSIKESFQDITLSKEKTLRGSYFGPKAIKFRKLNISGD